MYSDDEEGNTYNPVAFDNEYLDEPDDMELHFNFGYILNKNIVPVLPYGEKFLNEIEKLNQIRMNKYFLKKRDNEFWLENRSENNCTVIAEQEPDVIRPGGRKRPADQDPDQLSDEPYPGAWRVSVSVRLRRLRCVPHQGAGPGRGIYAGDQCNRRQDQGLYQCPGRGR